MHRWDNRVHEGMDVRDVDGDKIGKAGETISDYFNVDAGFLGMKEYYIPFDAITDVREDAVYVSARKSELGEMGWDRRPDAQVSTRSTGEADYDARGDTLRLREEELRAHKTSVETGQVELGKDVVEETRTMQVPVSREEVTVERHPVDRRPADRPIDETESETIRVPVREEQVEIEKTPVVYEEVGVGKRVSQQTQQVSETVRREELRVDSDGDVDVRRDPTT